MSNKPMRDREAGFSLSELMIAITIGLLILAGLAGVFSTTTRSRGEVDRANRQVENGRYAIQVLTEDLRLAGYFGELDPSALATPAAKPNPCATAAADLRSAMPLHIQGYDDGAGAPSCLQDVRGGTDILVVRRVSTCLAGIGGCDGVAPGYAYFQASLCNPVNSVTELATENVNFFFALDTDTDNLNLHMRDCTTTARLRRYITHIYFVANNNKASDGIPTLKRAELRDGQFTIVPLVEGIQDLQLEYGIDTDAAFADNAGSPNVYTTNPDTFNACVAAACMINWRSVVSVKMHLLARNTEQTAGYSDAAKTYHLGLDSNGAQKTASFTDGYKRHVYQTSVRLTNPAGRREP